MGRTADARHQGPCRSSRSPNSVSRSTSRRPAGCAMTWLAAWSGSFCSCAGSRRGRCRADQSPAGSGEILFGTCGRRRDCGGLGVGPARRTGEPERGNACPRRSVGDPSPETQVPKDVASGHLASANGWGHARLERRRRLSSGICREAVDVRGRIVRAATGTAASRHHRSTSIPLSPFGCPPASASLGTCSPMSPVSCKPAAMTGTLSPADQIGPDPSREAGW